MSQYASKDLAECQGTIHCGTGLISHARGPTDQGRESDGDPARPCTRSATGSSTETPNRACYQPRLLSPGFAHGVSGFLGPVGKEERVDGVLGVGLDRSV